MKKLLLFACMLFAAWQSEPPEKEYNVKFTRHSGSLTMLRLHFIDSICRKAEGLIGYKLDPTDAEQLRKDLQQCQALAGIIFQHIDTSIAIQLPKNKPNAP